MTWEQYIRIACAMAMYLLGLFQGKGRKGWSNIPLALVCGFTWPLMFAYGVWLEHFDPKREVKK